MSGCTVRAVDEFTTIQSSTPRHVCATVSPGEVVHSVEPRKPRRPSAGLPSVTAVLEDELLESEAERYGAMMPV